MLILLLLAFQDITVTASGALLDTEEGHTIVPIRVEHPSLRLVKFEKTPQLIQTFVDDTGDDLKLGTPHWEWHRNPQISPDGSVCTMELVATNLPREGARKVTVTGTLTFTAASGRDTFRELIQVVDGTSGMVGDIPYEIRNVRPDVGSPTKTVQIMYFGVSREKSSLIGIDYFYEDGTEMDAREIRFRYSKKGYLIHVRLPRGATAFEIEIDQWIDHELVEVPYELELAL